MGDRGLGKGVAPLGAFQGTLEGWCDVCNGGEAMVAVDKVCFVAWMKRRIDRVEYLNRSMGIFSKVARMPGNCSGKIFHASEGCVTGVANLPTFSITGQIFKQNRFIYRYFLNVLRI